MESSERVVFREKIRLHVCEWAGAPPGALLLHGIGNYGRYWDFVAAEVARRLRLVAPDARGHGDSGKPPTGYADGDYVADALAVADAAGLERFVLCGHSLGGRHAVELAARHPERVVGLLVLDAGPDVLPEGRGRARRLTAERQETFADEAEALVYLRRTSPGYADAVYENRVRFALRRRDDGRLAWRSSKDALLATMASRPRGDEAWRLVGDVRCPTILIRGTRSYALGADTARRMVAQMRDARLVEVDAGHNVALDQPRVTADALVALATAPGSG